MTNTDLSYGSPDGIKHPFFESSFQIDAFELSHEHSSPLCKSYHAIHKAAGKSLFLSIYYEPSDKQFIFDTAVTIPLKLSNIPGFVHLIDYCYTSDDEHFLVTAEELMPVCYPNPSDLNDPIKRSKVIFGIAAAMKALHSMNILFNFELCLAHICLDDRNEPRIRFAPGTQILLIPTCPNHFSKYVIFCDLVSEDEDEHKSRSIDVYSYGIILFILFTRKRLNRRITSSDLDSDSIPSNFKDLISKCIAPPSERPSFEEIVRMLRTGDYFDDPSINQDELHEYQDRVDPKTREDLLKEIKELKKQKRPSPNTQPNEMKILSAEELSNLRAIKRIGKGGFATVEQVARDEYFALKTIDAEGLTTENLRRFIREYEIINGLDHPNIIKAYGFSFGDKDHHAPSILLELCPRNLYEEVKNGSLSKVDIVFSIYQIVEAMKFVHSKGIIHRDLKPNNILIDAKGRVKVADFGIATYISLETQTNNVGTQKFMAPELLNENERYDNKVDIYSFGVLLFWVLTGGTMPKITVVQIGTGKIAPIPDTVNAFASQLIKDCWSFDPNLRPSFESISEKLKSNNFQILDLSSSEIRQVRNLVKTLDSEIGI